MKISIIVTVAKGNVIGSKNQLPWYLPADLKHFKEITMGHSIIMGKNTHISIGKVLPGRTNIVLTPEPNFKSEGATIAHSLDDAFEIAKKKNENESFVIGGASVYKQAVDLADKIYMTKIRHDFKGDVFFPKLEPKKWKMLSCEKHKKDEKNKYDFEFCIYERI